MAIALRAGKPEDFTYCRALYFAKQEAIAPEQEASFLERWHVQEVRIITRDGIDIGWLQSRLEGGTLYLVQLFIEADAQGKGVGTEVVKGLMNDAIQAGTPMTLGVVKTNPAKRLYDRLGFITTHEDERKFWMKYDAFKERV